MMTMLNKISVILVISGTMFAKCKQSVLAQFQSIRSLPKNSYGKSCILVLDTTTAPILSSLLSLKQLLQIGINDLYRADKIKKPDPTAVAIYFISCKSLPSMYNDFNSKEIQNSEQNDEDSERSAVEKKDKMESIGQNSLFYSINLLLCEPASQQILKEISEQENVIDKMASFGELYIPCKYVGDNIGLVAFSKDLEDYVYSLRKMSNINSHLMPKDKSKQGEKVKENQKYQQHRKREHTAHFIHKNNLSCLPDVHTYEHSKDSSSKEQQRFKQIEQNIKNYGIKLCQTLVAGVNVSISTVVKVVCQDNKFSSKIKDSFVAQLTDYLQSKFNQQIEADETTSMSGEKGSLFRSDGDQPEAKQVTVIIADRDCDILSPLVRNFYYLPLLMDVFNMKEPPDRKITIISNKIQPTVMEADDKIFNQYKNMIINEVFQKIDQNLQDYTAKSKAAKFHKESSEKKKEINGQREIQMKDKAINSTKDMRDVIKELPEYNKNIKSYKVNIEVLNAIGIINKERNLYEEAEFEHLIVTGFGGDKKQVKDKKIYEKLLIFLQDPAISTEDKCRLMVLSICCLDIDNSERTNLINRLSKIESHGDIAMALSKISSKGIKKYPVPGSMQKSKDAFMDRHQPTLSALVQQLLSSSGQTKLKSFKSQELKPLVISTKLKPSAKGLMSRQKQKSIEYLVSVCGGMGYNQISDIERVVQRANTTGNLKVSFVTDYIFTPSTYLAELCTLL